MPELDNQEISHILSEMATLLEIRGENPFRIRAYRKAAQVISGIPRSLAQIFKEEGEKGISELPGIGANITRKIEELLQTGESAQYRELTAQVPPALSHLVDIRGLGAVRLRVLHEKLNINNLEELKQAARGGEIRLLEGFGAKSEANILKGIADYEKYQGRYLLARALPLAEKLRQYILKIPGVERARIAGSVRRRKETVKDLDILVTGDTHAPLAEKLARWEHTGELIARGETKTTLLLENGMHADVRLLEPGSFGAGLHYFTGSQQHNIAMRHRAQERGAKLNEYGFYQNERPIADREEEGIFRALGLQFIPPELREGGGEIEAAALKRLPSLVELSHIKGDLHCHTTHSDGRQSIAEMAAAARERGYQYLAITDHSKGQTQAHGLDEERLARQMEEIDRLRAGPNDIELLKGIEVDILKDGELDLSRDILGRLDCVVASVHSYFNQSREETTARLIKAITSGAVHILGHPTARLINEREPVEADMEEVMKAARAHNVAMEVNAHGNRLDLNDVHCRLARETGVKLAISTDSHNSLHFPLMEYGVYTARRGWVEADMVINTWPCDKLIEFLRDRR